MIDAGDIHLADLNEERRRRVLVLSNRQFNQMARRVIVAPELFGAPDEVPFPWRIQFEDAVFAVDLVRSLPDHRILAAVGRVPADAMRVARQALLHIT